MVSQRLYLSHVSHALIHFVPNDESKRRLVDENNVFLISQAHAVLSFSVSLLASETLEVWRKLAAAQTVLCVAACPVLDRACGVRFSSPVEKHEMIFEVVICKNANKRVKSWLAVVQVVDELTSGGSVVCLMN